MPRPSLGLKLFSRRHGRYTPSPEARDIFSQVNAVYDKVGDLQYVIRRLSQGADSELRIGSVPSISNVMVPRAVEGVRKRFPNLLIDMDVLKFEEALDYILLGKGEAVAMSSRFDHPMMTFEPLAKGRLFCIVPEGHPLARRSRISAADIVRHPLIGIDPNDPYGRIMASIFARLGLTYEVTIKARFGTMVCALVGTRARHRRDRRVHLGRRHLAGHRGPADRRIDRVPDLYRLPPRRDAVELLRALHRAPAPGDGSAPCRRKAAAAEK